MLSWVQAPSESSLTPVAARERESTALLTWLALLHWPSTVERTGDVWAGTARHVATASAVSAVSSSRTETIWQLVEAVLAKRGGSDFA